MGCCTKTDAPNSCPRTCLMKLGPTLAPIPSYHQTFLHPLTCTYCSLFFTNLPLKFNLSPSYFMKTLMSILDPLPISDLLSEQCSREHQWSLNKFTTALSSTVSCIQKLFSPTRYEPPVDTHNKLHLCIPTPYSTEHKVGPINIHWLLKRKWQQVPALPEGK